MEVYRRPRGRPSSWREKALTKNSCQAVLAACPSLNYTFYRGIGFSQRGLGLGLIMVFGSLIGKKILDRLPERIFIFVIEVTLLIAGLRFLIYG
jgi:uncharacterized membrane protein YfcA